MKKIDSIEQTFLMIKPDGVKRGLVGDIFKRVERMGLKVVATRMIWATREQAKGNYPGTDQWLYKMGEKTFTNYKGDEKALLEDLGTTDLLEIGKIVYKSLVDYLTEGPVIISVWEGNNAVDIIAKLMGETNPLTADIGSVRGDYGFDTPKMAVKSGRIVFKTLVHRSDSKEEADREIKHWFGDKFKYLGDYKRVDYIGMI